MSTTRPRTLGPTRSKADLLQALRPRSPRARPKVPMPTGPVLGLRAHRPRGFWGVLVVLRPKLRLGFGAHPGTTRTVAKMCVYS